MSEKARKSAICLRRLAPGDDVDRLTLLLNRAYAELAERGFQYVATWQDAEITRRRVARGECWVAESDGEIVGTIVFEDAGMTSGCAWYDKPDVASFHQFAVVPERQGCGVGTLLLDRVERRAAETGAAEIALDTAEPAAHLIRFYERRGYRIVGEADWEPTNYRSVVLSKALGS